MDGEGEEAVLAAGEGEGLRCDAFPREGDCVAFAVEDAHLHLPAQKIASKSFFPFRRGRGESRGGGFFSPLRARLFGNGGGIHDRRLPRLHKTCGHLRRLPVLLEKEARLPVAEEKIRHRAEVFPLFGESGKSDGGGGARSLFRPPIVHDDGVPEGKDGAGGEEELLLVVIGGGETEKAGHRLVEADARHIAEPRPVFS